jgi:hypothetical protein
MGYEHQYGKYNGCPDDWWLDFGDKLIPYIDKGVHRICWGINYKQHNNARCKWNSTYIDARGTCEIYANGNLIYEFFSSDLGYALAKAQTLTVTLLEHPFNFIDQREEENRKIWYYGLPAIVKITSNPGNIRIDPDYSHISKDEWWNEWKKRRSNIFNYCNNTQDEEFDNYWAEECMHNECINHGDVLWDGMINWFRDDNSTVHSDYDDRENGAIMIKSTTETTHGSTPSDHLQSRDPDSTAR